MNQRWWRRRLLLAFLLPHHGVAIGHPSALEPAYPGLSLLTGPLRSRVLKVSAVDNP